MQILPPSIEFVLPSAALGIANLQAVDPPWMPHVKTRFQQVALNQEEFVGYFYLKNEKKIISIFSERLLQLVKHGKNINKNSYIQH